MRCPKCHAENRDDSRFCGNCAAPLSVEETISAAPTQTLAAAHVHNAYAWRE